jgi:hypothetical protein
MVVAISSLNRAAKGQISPHNPSFRAGPSVEQEIQYEPALENHFFAYYYMSQTDFVG